MKELRRDGTRALKGEERALEGEGEEGVKIGESRTRSSSREYKRYLKYILRKKFYLNFFF